MGQICYLILGITDSAGERSEHAVLKVRFLILDITPEYTQNAILS
jgi:hypothetical protein